MSFFVDRVIFNAASGGLTDFVVASAHSGYQTPTMAGAISGATYSYAAEFRDSLGNILAWEVGRGVWVPQTLTRTAVEASSNSNSKVNFAGPPLVMLTLLMGDVLSLIGPLPFAQLSTPAGPNALAIINDAQVGSWGAVIAAGGGSFMVLAWYDGVNWIVISSTTVASQSDAQPMGVP